eukprot:scaffold135229_cov112-Phaeocystis_antarctica.AAC.1
MASRPLSSSFSRKSTFSSRESERVMRSGSKLRSPGSSDLEYSLNLRPFAARSSTLFFSRTEAAKTASASVGAISHWFSPPLSSEGDLPAVATR